MIISTFLILYVGSFGILSQTAPRIPGVCAVCDVTDLTCIDSGTPTQCGTDNPFCMTIIYDDFPDDLTVERKCVDEAACIQLWYVETSWRSYCYDLDRGELYFSVNCSFCCTGDLCNSGGLVPNPNTLYYPENFTLPTPSAPPAQTLPTVPSTTPHLPICEVCRRDDPTCITGGRATRCDPDRPYCLTRIIEDSHFTQHVERSCVDLVTCEHDWLNETSNKYYCFSLDRGPAFFPNVCSFCCQGDNCNSGSLVPDAHTLYYPSSASTTTEEPATFTSSSNTPSTVSTNPPTTTIHHPVCETCPPSDPKCMTGGRPTVCDLDTPYCWTSVTEDGTQKRTAERGCVNATICEEEWVQKTANNFYCYELDQGPLYFPNTCSFCCQGDLCNSGTLVPDSHTLYSPSTTAPPSSSVTPGPSATPTTPTTITTTITRATLTTTIHHPICDTCTSDDPKCMTGGKPTSCDLTTPYCWTSVTEDGAQQRKAERGCVNATVCEEEWVHKTSNNFYCYQIDQGALYFPNTCSFCCQGDLCNSGTLVPDSHTLYNPPTQAPSPSPTTPKPPTTPTTTATTTTPTTTIYHPVCETCASDDPKCLMGGKPTSCDLTTPYCWTSVNEDGAQQRTAERGCVNATVCEEEWLKKTSNNFYCYELDQGPLYFPNTCSFCCQGDLCNSGTLVPDSHTLYSPPTQPPTVPLETSTVKQTTTTTIPTTTTVRHPICETCTSDDPKCMTGGQPTACDFDTPYCWTSVTEDGTQNRTAERRCVNATVCEEEWVHKTSNNFYCYQVDQGPLYFPNTCSFCCQGDLCNSGTLVPDSHTLCNPSTQTPTHIPTTSSTEKQTTTKPTTTTIHHPICETCTSDDPKCMTGGQPTTCDLDTPYCWTSVKEDGTQNRTAERKCVNATVCEEEWLKKTSNNFYCYQIDQGALYFPNTCSFCCQGDLCNSGTLVPDSHTLYNPVTQHPPNTTMTSPTVTESTTQLTTATTTIHHPVCETCTSDDPTCMTGGQQTLCDLDTPYCLTSVTEDESQNRTAERRCVNATVCEEAWLKKTSNNFYCYQIDQGALYFPNTCSFCCQGDLCNSGTLVPDSHTLYNPEKDAHAQTRCLPEFSGLTGVSTPFTYKPAGCIYSI